MKRWVAVLLAIIGGAIVAYTTILLVHAGFLFGVVWLGIFGDDPWPDWATTGFNLFLPVGGSFLWAVFGWLIWRRLIASFPSANS